MFRPVSAYDFGEISIDLEKNPFMLGYHVDWLIVSFTKITYGFFEGLRLGLRINGLHEKLSNERENQRILVNKLQGAREFDGDEHITDSKLT